MSLPKLFKKTSTGAIQYWSVSVIENSDHSTGYDLWTFYGQVGGKEQQTVDSIFEGKNVGKKNETTPQQQAESEAQAKWEKQLKRGYVQSLGDARADKLDEIIEGGIVPMLAFTFEKQGKKIKYPCFVQPKLDGIRCIAILKDGKCTLWSRTRKLVTSCPHIVAEIERIFRDDIILDGELYNHELKQDFEKIVSMVRQEEPADGHERVQYHIYDTVNKNPFYKRTNLLYKAFNVGSPSFKYLKLVETFDVEKEEDIAVWFAGFTDKGYEGAILRNYEGLYVNKRSADLIKVKEMQDDEFRIIGVEQGRGKLTGHVGAFVCLTSNDQEFKAKMSGSTEKLKEYWENMDLWRGKFLTVQFQDFTSYGIPRFPVGLRIREDV
jgi:DNA ligase-1